jgi:hypothetical protein
VVGDARRRSSGHRDTGCGGVLPGEQQRDRVPGRQRPAEAVPPAERAVEDTQRLKLVAVLQAIGDHLEVQNLRELSDGRDDGVALGTGRDAS